MGDAPAPRDFGQGLFSQIAAFVYTLLVVELLLLIGAAPGLALLLLLDRDASNLPLAAVCAAPLGPAISAALYALQQRRLDLTDLSPAAAFWRGYRLNLKTSLLVWVPWSVWMAVIGINLANLAAAGVPRWWSLLLVLVALGTTLWEVNALVITSLFAFRVRDVARLGGYFLIRTPGVTLANACLLVVAAGIVVVTSEAVLVLLGSAFALMLLRNSQSMVTEVREGFTA